MLDLFFFANLKSNLILSLYQQIEWGPGVEETRTDNQRSREIYSLRTIWWENSHWLETGRERNKKEKERIKKEIKSVHTLDI